MGTFRAVDFSNLQIGRDLKKMRLGATLSQMEVARKANIRPEVLCRIESGNGNPTVKTVARIVKALKLLSKDRK